MIAIPGNSGSHIEVAGCDGDLRVIKTFPPNHVKRMISQASKLRRPLPAGMRFPSVLEVDQTAGRIVMDYVPGDDMISLASWSAPSRFQWAIREVSSWVMSSISMCSHAPFPRDRWREKLLSVVSATAVQSPVLYDPVSRLASGMSDFSPATVQSGWCHGDLSLSNMIVEADRVCLIDPIDSPIDTPIEDAAKLLLDLDTCWSLSRCGLCVDDVKVRIRFQHAAAEIREKMAHLSEPHTVEMFRRMCLIRLAPYCQDDSSVSFMKREIGALL
jgi:hypothetical protein